MTREVSQRREGLFPYDHKVTGLLEQGGNKGFSDDYYILVELGETSLIQIQSSHS